VTQFITPIFLSNDTTDFRHLIQILSTTPGYNQNDNPNMLKATNDAQAIQSFLIGYQSSPLTYQNYMKELERLVLWCTHIQQLTISDLSHSDLNAYQQFLANPQPKEIWCGNKRAKCLKTGAVNPQWRVFSSPLSPISIKKIMSILECFFNYLVQTQYLKGNPLSVNKRRKKRTHAHTIERWLEKTEINAVLDALESYQSENPEDKFAAIRAKYIVHTLFYTGLRLSELCYHSMGHFKLIENQWYIKVIGKGEKPRNIVILDEYLDALMGFRKAIGCPSALPAFDDPLPLIPANDLKTPILNRRIDQILKWAFELGAKQFESMSIEKPDSALEYQHRASKLRKASAHWLRHSYGTYLVKSGCPIEKVKTLMGHADITTTMIYVHIAKEELHDSAKGLTLQE
jgi:site-specific recombinase XerD